jgi:hypothetical protein
MYVIAGPTRVPACLFVAGSVPAPVGPRPVSLGAGRPVPLDHTHGPPRPSVSRAVPYWGRMSVSRPARAVSPLSPRPYGPLSGIPYYLKTPLKATTGRLSYVRPVSAPSRLPRLSPRAAYIPVLGRLRAVFGEYRVFINLCLTLLCGFVSRGYFTRVSPHRGL